jgi:hypothetical protein
LQPQTAPAETREIPLTSDIAIMAAVAGSIALGIIPTGLLNLATQSVDAVRTVFGLGP